MFDLQWSLQIFWCQLKVKKIIKTLTFDRFVRLIGLNHSWKKKYKIHFFHFKRTLSFKNTQKKVERFSSKIQVYIYIIQVYKK